MKHEHDMNTIKLRLFCKLEKEVGKFFKMINKSNHPIKKQAHRLTLLICQTNNTPLLNNNGIPMIASGKKRGWVGEGFLAIRNRFKVGDGRGNEWNGTFDTMPHCTIHWYGSPVSSIFHKKVHHYLINMGYIIYKEK